LDGFSVESTLGGAQTPESASHRGGHVACKVGLGLPLPAQH